jgi:hypothetical protein
MGGMGGGGPEVRPEASRDRVRRHAQRGSLHDPVAVPTHITKLLVPGVRVRSYASQKPEPTMGRWWRGVNSRRRRRVQLASTSR